MSHTCIVTSNLESRTAPAATWDPQQYLRFADERGRPFAELVHRIGGEPATVQSVVDLGCGPGNLTATLLDSFPHAMIVGVDSSESMLADAAPLATERLRFERGTVQDWRPSAPVDVLVSNATLQWVPNHLQLLPRLVESVSPGGWLAFQLPGNLDDAHHQRIAEVCARPRWAPTVGDAPNRGLVAHSPVEYADVLANLGMTVDVWTTSYLHILTGEDPVLEWVKGTGMRPVLARLSSQEQIEFCAELAPLLRSDFPSRRWGTPFPFRRIFVVAQRPAT
jgi:trans-aconitate 2-methyltransferase